MLLDNGDLVSVILKELALNIYEALYTTRSMRRLKPDPIPLDVQARILDAAIRAPSGSNLQRWRFLLVDDPAVRNQLGPLYRAAVQQLWATAYPDRIERANQNPELDENKQTMRLVNSAQHLADHFEEIPLLLFAFAQMDSTGSSIFPAIWSAMLAARAEGVGSCLTTILDFRHDEVYEVLGVPGDGGWEMKACVTLGYPTGRWGVAERQPVQDVTYRNQWDSPSGFAFDSPLWPGSEQ